VQFDLKTKNPGVFDLDFINSVLIAPGSHYRPRFVHYPDMSPLFVPLLVSV